MMFFLMPGMGFPRHGFPVERIPVCSPTLGETVQTACLGQAGMPRMPDNNGPELKIDKHRSVNDDWQRAGSCPEYTDTNGANTSKINRMD